MSEKFPLLPITEQQFQELVARANGGDRAALAGLRKLLDDNPTIWQSVGDMYERAKLALIMAIARNDKLLVECLRRQADELERDVLSAQPSLLEKMTVQRLVTAWLRVNHVDQIHPEARGKGLAMKAAAERDFRTALRNLELVRSKLSAHPKTTQSASGKRRKRKEKAAVPVNRIKDFALN